RSVPGEPAAHYELPDYGHAAGAGAVAQQGAAPPLPASSEGSAAQHNRAAAPHAPVTTPEGPAAVPQRRPVWLAWLPPSARLGLPVLAVSLALLLARFLLPSPVGQADNRDGPRLMCNLGLGPADPQRHRRYFDYAYFDYVPSRAACAGRHLYPSSELVPLQLAKVLTPVFKLPSSVNLIALGVIFCVAAAAGIALLAVGLRMRPWAQLLVAAAAWVIVADAAFFDVFASPFSRPPALVGFPPARARGADPGPRAPPAAPGLLA